MPPKLSLAEQKKKLKEKAQRAKDQEKREKDKERAERKAQEQKDRIFGLKNKHTSKHAQQFVQDVERNMKQLPGEQQKAEAKKRENDKRKAAEEQAQRELDEMMGLAIKQPKVPEGVDPKTIPCEFFKKGRCAKGWKCKFSHEKNTRKGTEKIDLFVDHRDDAEKEKDSDKMDDWDQDKLESVVKEKHSGENQNNKTDIVCKHFLEAVEKRLYGWFWVCPNGGNECKYRHALPPGYVLKSQLKAMMEEEKASQRTDEEILEEERAKIGEGVPVTQDTFAEWKRARDARVAQSKADVKQRRIDEGRLSGRELCEGGLVESGGHEEAGAMEYIKRDTSADDAAEARAKEEAERNLARMRAMFSASGGVEGGDRSEWFAQGGQDDEDDDFFVDDDDLDPDELAAMLGHAAVGGDGPAPTLGTDNGPAIISASNRARAAAAAARRRQAAGGDEATDQALSGFLSHLDGVDGAHSGSGARIIGTIKHREKPKAAKPKKSSGRKDGSDDEPEEELDPELAALLARKTDAAAQLKEVNIHTGLVTKSGAKSKAVLEKEAREAAEKAKASKNDDPFAVDDDDIDLGDLVAAVSKPPAKNDDPFAVDDDDIDLGDLVAAVKR